MRQNEWVQTYYTVKIFIDVNTVSINVIWWYKTISISRSFPPVSHTASQLCSCSAFFHFFYSLSFLILFLSFVLSPRFSSLRFSILPTNDEFILFLSLSLSLFFFYSFFLFFFFNYIPYRSYSELKRYANYSSVCTPFDAISRCNDGNEFVVCTSSTANGYQTASTI